LAAEVQTTVAYLGLIVEPVRLVSPRADQMRRQHYNVTFTLLGLTARDDRRKIAGFRQLERGEWQRL
jgi:hypothetical protein